MDIESLHLRFDHGLWLGTLPTRFGEVEVMLNGTAECPDDGDVAALQRFAAALDVNLGRLRKNIRFALFHHPIRIAVNTEHRVGIQFRNWLTNSQRTLVFWEDSPNKATRR
jgi:hypothetical protein